MDPRAIELIQLQIDKQLGEHGEAELDARLRADPALVAYRESLRDVVLALRSAPTPEVPAGFRAEILRRAASLRRSKVRALPLRPYWRTGFALAASVLLAVVVVQIADQGPIGAQEQAFGTMAPAMPTVAVTAAGDGLQLEFDVPPGPPGRLVIDFAESGRQIVVPDVLPGRRTVHVFGESADFMASLEREGAQVPVARRP